MTELLQYAKASGFFQSIDCHFAKTVSADDPKKQLLALLTSHAYGLKHTMMTYRFLYDSSLWLSKNDAYQNDKAKECAQKLKKLANINKNEDWHKTLETISEQKNSPISITEVGIYLTKNLNFEKNIVKFLHTNQSCNTFPTENTIELLHKLFPKEDSINRQKLAAANALISPVSIISGGPGTGKTTTVIKILLLLLNENPNLHISLAAPTGKAAARLSESIEKQKASFKTTHPQLENLLDKIPNSSTTLHRLLKFNPSQIKPKFHAYHPLPTDLIIIDEASMIDLYIFNLLIQALPKHIRVIILGDKDQLASVEAGAIMGEACKTIGYDQNRLNELEKIIGESLSDEFQPLNAPLNNVTLLTKSYRFSEKSGIGQLSSAINQQDALAFEPIIEKFPNELKFVNSKIEKKWLHEIDALLKNYHQLCQTETRITELFKALHQMRILCATNVSDFGTKAINEYISTQIFKSLDNHMLYHGQAIMILQNDYVNNVFNGDIGIIFKENNKVIAYFESDNESPRSIPVQLLPQYETAFAMTIHKSQGSEFDNVIIVLPDFSSQILTTELLYTGITRAKKTLTVIAEPEIIKNTIKKKTDRFSGISHQLEIL